MVSVVLLSTEAPLSATGAFDLGERGAIPAGEARQAGLRGAMGGSKRKQREKLISEEFTQSLFGKESSIAATPDENIFFVDDASQKSKERKSAKAKAAPARKAAKAGAKGAASTAGKSFGSSGGFCPDSLGEMFDLRNLSIRKVGSS